MKSILISAFLLVTAGCVPTYDPSLQAPARVLYPVQKCGYERVPIWGQINRPASSGEILGGAAIGGIIGNQLDDHGAVGTIGGAIIGGALANQRRTEPVAVGWQRVYKCRTVYE